MKTLELSEVSALSPLVESGSQEPLLITRNGRTVATVIPSNEEEAESLLLSINPQFGVILERSQRRLEAEGGLSTDEVRNRLGLS